MKRSVLPQWSVNLLAFMWVVAILGVLHTIFSTSRTKGSAPPRPPSPRVFPHRAQRVPRREPRSDAARGARQVRVTLALPGAFRARALRALKEQRSPPVPSPST
jgi:hypothetical protein